MFFLVLTCKDTNYFRNFAVLFQTFNFSTLMPDVKLLPMGISDFRRIRLENYYYVDKTEWIPKLEFVSSFLFFCRPPRFGKTLMLSLL